MRNVALILLAALPLVALLRPHAAWSQVAEEMEAALEAPALSYAEAARFVLEAADTGAPVEPQAAFRFAQERSWLPARVLPDGSARLGPVALLIMRSFNLKGGLLYTFFPNAHFAYRELSHRRVIQDADPEMTVSGGQLFFMLGRILALRTDGTVSGGAQ